MPGTIKPKRKYTITLKKRNAYKSFFRKNAVEWELKFGKVRKKRKKLEVKVYKRLCWRCGEHSGHKVQNVPCKPCRVILLEEYWKQRRENNWALVYL